jgi:two-component system, cell cycle sensor histidine kinase and response regulator CckA
MDEPDSVELRAQVASLEQKVTELERQLQSSRSASAFLESVLQAVPAFITNLDPDLKIRFLNRYQPGHTLASVVGKHVFEYTRKEDREIVQQQIDLARATGQVTSYTVHHAAGPHGQTASYLTRVAPVAEPEGGIGVCLAFVDITEQEQQARALREMQAQLTLALDATGLCLWSWDAQSGEVVWDERMRALHGRETPVALEAYREICVHPDDRETIQGMAAHALETGSFPQTAFRIVRPDGQVRWLLSLGRVMRDEQDELVRIVGGSLDITRQRELEEQARKSQRMAAITSLTAGVAHNFNNMLAVISPIVELATELVPPEHRRMMQDASHAAQRAAELVRQLMTYAGQSSAQKHGSCELGLIVQAAVNICRRSFAPHIALRFEQRVPRVAVACDSGQLEQVLVNLLLNARDAIDEANAPEGKVVVRIRLANEDDALPSESTHDATRGWVCVDVIDDGPGLTEEARARLFEPFFTTKPFGKGTGLGLATSFAIARDHGGTLSCERHRDKGTRFTLALPTVAPRSVETIAAPTTRLPHGTQILVVDDDDAVRRTLTRVFASHGLRVREANSGESAVETLRAYPGTQFVLLDRTMPGGSGERFIPRMREIARAARIIFLTGRGVEPELEQLVDSVVSKPITGSELIAVMGRLLAPEDD